MPLDFNNPFLQQKITKQADEQFKDIYKDDFYPKTRGSQSYHRGIEARREG